MSFLRSLLLVAIACSALAINLRTSDADVTDDRQMSFLSGEQACVQVFSECNFGGQSATICGEQVTSFPNAIRSAKVPDGWAASVNLDGVIVNIWDSVACVNIPINSNEKAVKVSVRRLD